MFTSWDNVNLEKYPWYAGKLARKETSEYLYRFPIGKVWVCCRVSVQGVELLWGDCRFIPADWGS